MKRADGHAMLVGRRPRSGRRADRRPLHRPARHPAGLGLEARHHRQRTDQRGRGRDQPGHPPAAARRAARSAATRRSTGPSIRRGQEYDLALAAGDRVRLFRRTWGTVDGREQQVGNNGDVVEVLAQSNWGLRIRTKEGEVADVEWRRLADRETGRLMLGIRPCAHHRRSAGHHLGRAHQRAAARHVRRDGVHHLRRREPQSGHDLDGDLGRRSLRGRAAPPGARRHHADHAGGPLGASRRGHVEKPYKGAGDRPPGRRLAWSRTGHRHVHRHPPHHGRVRSSTTPTPARRRSGACGPRPSTRTWRATSRRSTMLSPRMPHWSAIPCASEKPPTTCARFAPKPKRLRGRLKMRAPSRRLVLRREMGSIRCYHPRASPAPRELGRCLGVGRLALTLCGYRFRSGIRLVVMGSGHRLPPIGTSQMGGFAMVRYEAVLRRLQIFAARQELAEERTRCAGGVRGVDGRVVAQLVRLD